MHTLPSTSIHGIADACVSSMGDIFWDYVEARDAPLGFADPRRIAIEAVASTLIEFAATLESDLVYTTPLRMEYQALVSRVGDTTDDVTLVSSLVNESAWTEEGATTILRLARDYGTSILRNALALAESLDIEDGEVGL